MDRKKARTSTEAADSPPETKAEDPQARARAIEAKEEDDSPQARAIARAKQIATYLDLTSLNDSDTKESIIALCDRAIKFNVAAVCVCPRCVQLAVERLKGTPIKVASVANFPQGSDDLIGTSEDIGLICDRGGHEVDVVLPYRFFLAGRRELCREFLERIKEYCDARGRPLTLKVIIESGELKDQDLIRDATQLCLDIGADFVKTSTGKTKVSATVEAAECILQTMQQAESGTGHRKVGFKASGGIRTIEDAEKYLRLVETTFNEVPTSDRFRIGASGLLNDIERVINSNIPPSEGSTHPGESY